MTENEKACAKDANCRYSFSRFAAKVRQAITLHGSRPPGRFQQRRRLLEELDDRRRGSHLPDPEGEHPLDDFGLVVGHLGAEFRSIALLMTEIFME